jgi:hypothetical protein
MSIAGCGKKTTVVYCNAGDSGIQVGTVTTITLQPKLYGISLNYAQKGQVAAPSATDCKSNAVTVASYTYGTTDMTIADINPATGALCGGTWNRNTGGGIADYTTCNPTNKSGTAYITASAQGATSNPIPVFVHPVVTSVVLGAPSTDCVNDPATNCSPAATDTTASGSCTVNPATGCCTAPIQSTSNGYSPNACLSQGVTGQLAARVYAGAGTGQTNISCYAGHLTYTPQTSSIVTIDQNGIATAQNPGSTIISSSLSNAGSSAGFFSTCPPTSITLSIPNSSSTNVTVQQNNTQPITATAVDKNGVVLTGLSLEYVSTTPTTLPSGGTSSVTPIFPGAGSITAICQPPTCNTSPFNQIGLYGNGKQVVSNAINVTTPGTNSTILYIASTQSLYIVPVDFTTNTLGAPVRLPYTPTSMVISNDGTSIYMGSTTALMVFNASANTLTRTDQSVTGNVLAVSPDNSTLVVTDPVRQLIYLYSSAGAITSQIGGVGTHAQFTPDSATVYVTAGNQLLVHSTFTGWTTITGSTIPPLATPTNDVAVTVPSVGAFFAGATTTARGSCPATTTGSVDGLPTTTNVFYPDAGVAGPQTDRVSATNDGKHILGATVTPTATLTDLSISSLNAANPGDPGDCPTDGSALTFTTTPVLTTALPGVTATSITGVLPSSDSSTAFITYTGSGGKVPEYLPAASGAGTVGSVTLSGSATAPVAGVFSSDNTTFYVGTSGDNQVHILTKGANGFADTTAPIAPKLPDANGNIVVPNLLVQRPRKIN